MFVGEHWTATGSSQVLSDSKAPTVDSGLLGLLPLDLGSSGYRHTSCIVSSVWREQQMYVPNYCCSFWCCRKVTLGYHNGLARP